MDYRLRTNLLIFASAMANWFTSLFGGDTAPKDFSVLKVDLHSHLIPGIDDGAQTMEDSMQLIQKLKAMGTVKN